MGGPCGPPRELGSLQEKTNHWIAQFIPPSPSASKGICPSLALQPLGKGKRLVLKIGFVL